MSSLCATLQNAENSGSYLSFLLESTSHDTVLFFTSALLADPNMEQDIFPGGGGTIYGYQPREDLSIISERTEIESISSRLSHVNDDQSHLGKYLDHLVR
jgi:hypothetical protein